MHRRPDLVAPQERRDEIEAVEPLDPVATDARLLPCLTQRARARGLVSLDLAGHALPQPREDLLRGPTQQQELGARAGHAEDPDVDEVGPKRAHSARTTTAQGGRGSRRAVTTLATESAGLQPLEALDRDDEDRGAADF